MTWRDVTVAAIICLTLAFIGFNFAKCEAQAIAQNDQVLVKQAQIDADAKAKERQDLIEAGRAAP